MEQMHIKRIRKQLGLTLAQMAEIQGYKMYKVYLKVFNERGLSEVVKDSRTTTPSPLVAETAFRELISRDDLVGKKVHAVLSLDSRQLMYHRFDQSPGQIDYVSSDAAIKLFHEE